MFRLFVIAALSIVSQAAACAQEAKLSGRVVDAQGGAAPGVEVRLLREDLTTTERTTTRDDGSFVFDKIAPANFVLEAEKEGFRTLTQPLTVRAGSAEQLTLKLDVAGVNQAVFVTAAGTAQTFDEVSKSATLVTAEDIENRNEYSLQEIVRYAPGIQIRNSGGPGQAASIRIRGLRPDASAVLIDGLRFRDSSTTQSDASSFLPNLNLIATDRVEVLRGSGSSLYGTNAVGGVINVVTDQGGGAVRGQVQLEGGNFGFLRGRATLAGGALEDRLTYSAGLLHLNVMEGRDGNDRARSSGVQGFAKYALTPRMNISGRIFASDDFAQTNVSPSTSGIPSGNFPSSLIIDATPLAPSQVELLNAGSPFSYGNATFIPGRDDPDSRRTSEFYTSAFIFRHALTPVASWQASYQRVHTFRIFQNGPAGGGFQPSSISRSDFTGDIDTIDVRGLFNPTPWLNVIGGYEFEREYYADLQDNNLPGPARLRTETSVDQKGHAGYAVVQLAMMNRRLQLSFSGRAQKFDLSRPVFSVTGTSSGYDRVPLPDPPSAITGDASIAYFVPRTNTKFRGHAGNAYRAPALYERFGGGFSNDPVSGQVIFSPFGDPRLSPDRYNTFDAGVDQYLFGSRLQLSATAFYNRVVQVTAFDSSGVIRPNTDPYGRAFGYINGSGGISRGVELSFETRPMRSLNVFGSYTYTNADTDRDVTIRNFHKVPGVQDHTFTLVANQQWTRRLETTFDLFHGSEHFGSFFAGFSSRPFRFPSITKSGLIGSFRIWEGERKFVRLYAKVDNLFNQDYYEGGWRALGLNGLGGLAIHF